MINAWLDNLTLIYLEVSASAETFLLRHYFQEILDFSKQQVDLDNLSKNNDSLHCLKIRCLKIIIC